MLKKTITIFSLAVVLTAFHSSPVSSNQLLSVNAEGTFVNQSLGLMKTVLTMNEVSVKQQQPYDKANDPAHRGSTEFSEAPRPQHGYFAVPLIVLGLAGILLYFSRLE